MTENEKNKYLDRKVLDLIGLLLLTAVLIGAPYYFFEPTPALFLTFSALSLVSSIAMISLLHQMLKVVQKEI